ncbi:hypothetical protein [Billgrantia endophytica]|uniref:Uncharacterized protein n=1 Tax=Billgrantia endophytica TaxID=2033802 RepID=A0A2N7TZY0_9GAMM|nr:hypothetical protein [Halomonas endophytica]PMR73747.1 hypothetical protein C1H69_15540 [Halomonas endophytica]
MDALNSRYLSYCAVADDVPGYAQSMLIDDVNVDGNNVHLMVSEPLQWDELARPGQGFVIAWRRPDGTTSGPWPAQPGDNDHYVIALMSEIPEVTDTTSRRTCYSERLNVGAIRC